MSGAAPGSATVVCMLGMHRSGTSLVARMLNLLGVDLGPAELISRTGDDNPKGYWEHRLFVEVNETILARFGGRWDGPPVFPEGWPRSPRLADLRDKARQFLAESFATAPLWGWKDPRSCLTLPFWQALIGPMRYVMCVRNPRAVAASLARRNGTGLEAADRLWLAHTQASLAATTGQPRLFVFYEDLLEDWPAELRRMAAFVGHPERAEDSRVRDAVAAFLDVELCHHRSTFEELAGDERISRSTKALYVEMEDLARPSRATAASVCFCTLAIHAPYRQRARLLCADVAPAPMVVLTDDPADFADLPVRAIRHAPTGPMAIDYLQRLGPTGDGRGAAAYHDKRFAIQAALEHFDTAIFLDADSRIDSLHSSGALPPTVTFPAGLAVLPVVRKSVADHLDTCGPWRLPAFVELARDLMGSPDALHDARWCHETIFAVTKDGNEDRFFRAWDQAAIFMQRQGVYSGEGGVMGLAAACAGWSTDYDALARLEPLIRHEGGGPKEG